MKRQVRTSSRFYGSTGSRWNWCGPIWPAGGTQKAARQNRAALRLNANPTRGYFGVPLLEPALGAIPALGGAPLLPAPMLEPLPSVPVGAAPVEAAVLLG